MVGLFDHELHPPHKHLLYDSHELFWFCQEQGGEFNSNCTDFLEKQSRLCCMSHYGSASRLGCRREICVSRLRGQLWLQSCSFTSSSGSFTPFPLPNLAAAPGVANTKHIPASTFSSSVLFTFPKSQRLLLPPAAVLWHVLSPLCSVCRLRCASGNVLGWSSPSVSSYTFAHVLRSLGPSSHVPNTPRSQLPPDCGSRWNTQLFNRQLGRKGLGLACYYFRHCNKTADQ